MTRDDRHEPNRFLGFPVGEDFLARKGSHARTSEQPQQRVMGFPVDGFDPADLEWLDSLVHPVRAWRRWARRRRP
jgi:hypothetical protein